MNRELLRFLHAAEFLTRLPVSVGERYDPEHMAASVRYYPLVGALVGSLLALTLVTTSHLFGALPGIVVTITAGIALTGAFHEDGLADTFDGIGGGVDRDTALAIMRDSRLGTYGTLALVCALLLKATSLYALPISVAAGTLIIAHTLSRFSSVVVIATASYVRDEGTGKPVSTSLSSESFVIALACSAAILLGGMVILPWMALLCGLCGTGVAHLILRRWVEKRIQGYTGDTLGATQQVSELGFYLGVLAWH